MEHDFGHLTLWHLAIREPLPVVIELATGQVLHHHNQLLLLGFRHCVDELDYILMFQTAESFDLLLNHLIALLLTLHVQCLDCNKLTCDFIFAESDLSEATLSQMLLEFQRIDAHRIVEIVVERVEQTFDLRKLTNIVL